MEKISQKEVSEYICNRIPFESTSLKHQGIVRRALANEPNVIVHNS